VWVVLNRVRSGAVPGDPARELSAALERFAGVTPAALLPTDAPALDDAIANGRLLSESSPGSVLRHGIIQLAAALTGVDVAASKRRRKH
jgi:Flp pilus assembly CpaE family ATPase